MHPTSSMHPTQPDVLSLVDRRPGLLALLVTLVVGAVAVSVAVGARDGEPAGPPQVRDGELGVTFVLPEGWAVQEGEGIYGISSGAAVQRADGSGARVSVGLLDSSLNAGADPNLAGAAQRLANDWGLFAIPVRGTRTEHVDRLTTVDGRRAWESGYRVVPDGATADGGYVRTTVIEDGERRLYVLVLADADPQLLAQAEAAASTLRFG